MALVVAVVAVAQTYTLVELRTDVAAPAAVLDETHERVDVRAAAAAAHDAARLDHLQLLRARTHAHAPSSSRDVTFTAHVYVFISSGADWIISACRLNIACIRRRRRPRRAEPRSGAHRKVSERLQQDAERQAHFAEQRRRLRHAVQHTPHHSARQDKRWKRFRYDTIRMTNAVYDGLHSVYSIINITLLQNYNKLHCTFMLTLQCHESEFSLQQI